MKVLPVIHFLDRATALAEAQVARNCGADGVFLISHRGSDYQLLDMACAAKAAHPHFRVGVNLLSWSPDEAAFRAQALGLDMAWADDMGVDSQGLSTTALALSEFARTQPAFELFASVAFKYRAHEPDPALAAKNALAAGFIPTTSGAATGNAPDVAKIAGMSQAVGGKLAIASGMTPENVSAYAPYLSHILVATGVARDEYRIDPDKLVRLITAARAAARAAALVE